MISMPLELVSVLVITILAVISPGPDFALVSKISISEGRRAGVLCALGIGAGISVHLLYTLVGFGVLLAEQVWLLDGMRIVGALYLLWLGVAALWPDVKKMCFWLSGTQLEEERTAKAQRVSSSAFMAGFICNALNPKTMLFIVALFSQVISANSAIWLEVGYGLYIAVVHFIWFAMVACLLSSQALEAPMQKAKRWLERLSGGVMLLFGIKLIFS